MQAVWFSLFAIMIPGVYAPPAAATPGITSDMQIPHIYIVGKTATSVKISWDAVNDVMEYHVKYYMYNEDNREPRKQILVASANETEIEVTNLKPKTEYNIEVIAVTNGGMFKKITDDEVRFTTDNPDSSGTDTGVIAGASVAGVVVILVVVVIVVFLCRRKPQQTSVEDHPKYKSQSSVDKKSEGIYNEIEGHDNNNQLPEENQNDYCLKVVSTDEWEVAIKQKTVFVQPTIPLPEPPQECINHAGPEADVENDQNMSALSSQHDSSPPDTNIDLDGYDRVLLKNVPVLVETSELRHNSLQSNIKNQNELKYNALPTDTNDQYLDPQALTVPNEQESSLKKYSSSLPKSSPPVTLPKPSPKPHRATTLPADSSLKPPPPKTMPKPSAKQFSKDSPKPSPKPSPKSSHTLTLTDVGAGYVCMNGNQVVPVQK